MHLRWSMTKPYFMSAVSSTDFSLSPDNADLVSRTQTEVCATSKERGYYRNNFTMASGLSNTDFSLSPDNADLVSRTQTEVCATSKERGYYRNNFTMASG